MHCTWDRGIGRSRIGRESKSWALWEKREHMSKSKIKGKKLCNISITAQSQNEVDCGMIHEQKGGKMEKKSEDRTKECQAKMARKKECWSFGRRLHWSQRRRKRICEGKHWFKIKNGIWSSLLPTIGLRSGEYTHSCIVKKQEDKKRIGNARIPERCGAAAWTKKNFRLVCMKEALGRHSLWTKDKLINFYVYVDVCSMVERWTDCLRTNHFVAVVVVIVVVVKCGGPFLFFGRFEGRSTMEYALLLH